SLPDSGYLRAKVAQEQLIAKSGLPYSIVRATQFFEFAKAIGEAATVDGVVHAPSALMQPIAAEDVASTVGRVTVGAPVNGVVEVGGPELIGMDDLIRRSLTARGDSREVVTDPHARYFGTELGERSLVTGEGGLKAGTTFADWLAAQGE
ncbi:MAG TPA: NmrA family transcriptional regulator, partial [Umezawaea sp.]|nr:NmrA family transcriptional regulator [Umezawaea sp.]